MRLLSWSVVLIGIGTLSSAGEQVGCPEKLLTLPKREVGETGEVWSKKTKAWEKALRERALSLSEAGVIALANEAHKKGWDAYVVNSGILVPYLESKRKGEPFTATTMVEIAKNPEMHPAFRADMAG